jgi:hypothetical protein
MNPIVRIGAGTAFFNDSRMGIAQLLAKGGRLDYIIFDFLAESVVGGLGRGLATGTGPGFVADFIDNYYLPHLPELKARGIRVIANAGGLDPVACARMLREKAEAVGHPLRVGAISGDNLCDRLDRFVTADTREMFDGSSLREKIDAADRVNSLAAYTGGFPVAAALGAGAEVVLAGRAADSALTLGALIHEFGWGADDFDKLAAGTLAGHLLECSAQVTGGTFTDWRDVPDWAGIGMPIGECAADGSFVLTKPEDTGGLVTPGTVAEQMLYEVSDPQRYYVPDVVCDFTGVKLEQVASNRVAVSGARGLGRTATYKATLTCDRGWRATALLPIVGREARAKAERVGSELFRRVDGLLLGAQLPPLERMRCDVVGGGPGEQVAICRLVADHATRAGAEMFAREQGTAISHMSVGISISLGSAVRPVQYVAGFLVPKSTVPLSVEVNGKPVPCAIPTDERDLALDTPAPAWPPAPADAGAATVPLIRLAFARSGDKGNLFNVAVIARDPAFLPYIGAALTPETVGRHYAGVLGGAAPFAVDAFSVPGFSALNFVVRDSLGGGMLASMAIDPAAKGMGQLLLDYPVPVSAAIAARLGEAGGA